MVSEYEVKGFEIAMVVSTAIHVTRFLIVELVDLWIFVQNVTEKQPLDRAS